MVNEGDGAEYNDFADDFPEEGESHYFKHSPSTSVNKGKAGAKRVRGTTQPFKP